MASPKVLDRIKKLLALAGSNPSQEEAQAAMLQAQRLMAEHQVGEDVLAAEIEADEAASIDIEITGKRDRDYEAIAGVVGKNFRCKHYITQALVMGKRVTVLRFLGMQSDSAAAKLVYEMAKTSMLSNRAAYIKERQKQRRKEALERNDSFKRMGIGRIYDPKIDAMELRSIRIQWTNAFITGMASAFSDQVEQNKWAMVLQLPALVLVEAERIGLKKARGFGGQRVFRDEDAVTNGRQAGEAFAKVSRSGNQGPAGGPKLLGA